MRDVLVYVAGPISKGNLADNIRLACRAGLVLVREGIPCIVPHLTCYLGQMCNHAGAAVIPESLPYGTTIQHWYLEGVAMVRRCDAVLRLPGESTGSDLEVKEARALHLPVFHSTAEVLFWAKDRPFVEPMKEGNDDGQG